MTASHSDPADGFDHEAFRTALRALLDQARRADVDLEGAYNVRTPLPDQPDHTVEISKLQKTVIGPEKSGPQPDR